MLEATLYQTLPLRFNRMDHQLKKRVGEVLSKNLEPLKENTGLEDGLIAKKAGVARKTVNNMTASRHSTTVGAIAAVASVFRAEAWQMLVSGMPTKKYELEQFARLVRMYLALSDGGRESVVRTAEIECKDEGIFGDFRDGDDSSESPTHPKN